MYCALLIVFIHMAIGDNYAVLFCLTRQAVPFFFLASGFFFSKKIKKSNNKLFIAKQYVLNILRLYCIWVLLWSPVFIREYRQLYGDSTIKLIAALFRRFVLAGIAPYWYLLVLAEGVTILAFIIKSGRKDIGVFLCVAGSVLCVLYDIQVEYCQDGLVYRLFYTLFSWRNNVIMFGFPMLFIGAVVESFEEKINKQSIIVLLFLYTVSIILPFAGFYLNKELTSFFQFGTVQGILLFLICIHPTILENMISDKISKGARNLSSILFLTHTASLTILGELFHVWDSPVRYMATLSFSVLLFLIVGKTKMGFLKWLLMQK